MNARNASELKQLETELTTPLGVSELLEEMIMALVDHPGSVRVKESKRGPKIFLEVDTDPRDRGQVIGKSGKTIESIRMFLNVVAARTGCHVVINILNDEPRPSSNGPGKFTGTTYIMR